MRLTSEIWVSAFLRAEQAAGAFATVLRRGTAEAGAIFVVHSLPDRTASVYAPAPQAVFGAGESAERRFELVREALPESDVRDYLDRQIAFDSDCWIVETERRDPPNLFT